MYSKHARLERVIRKIEAVAGEKFYGWNVNLDEILYLWKRNLPIPFRDRNGNKYLYFKRTQLFVPDTYLSSIEKEALEVIQQVSIDAAANNKTFIVIDDKGHIEGTDISVEMSPHYLDLLIKECGSDCAVIKNENKITLIWDD